MKESTRGGTERTKGRQRKPAPAQLTAPREITPVPPTEASRDSDDPSRPHLQKPAPALPFFVVGIGASAGGLDALAKFFAKMDPGAGLAYIVIQHLSPDHRSFMVELLSRRTPIPVCRAQDGSTVEANHIYLIPPGNNLAIRG